MLIPKITILNKLYPILFLVLILVSCSSYTQKSPEIKNGSASFEFPELNQTEISTGNYRDLEEYSYYNTIAMRGPVIPGIFQSAVPQGMAYYGDSDLLLISSYMFDGRPSTVTAVSMADGRLSRVIWLLAPDGTPFKGHVGGLAVSRKYLWISSGKGVYNIPLKDIDDSGTETRIVMGKFIPTEVKGSFASFSSGVLWVGEFTSRDGNYTASKSHYFKTAGGNINHGLMAGYILDGDSDLIKEESVSDGVAYPDYIISIPPEVQGAVFTEGKIVFSQSYGRKNNSRISVYPDPLENPVSGTFEAPDGRTIPVWILGEDILEKKITAPPMTEGLTLYNNLIAVLYESGSDKYRATARNPRDSVDFLTLPDFN